MNNDHYARFLSSLHPNGSEFSFPQFEMVGAEHEELNANSYYSSVQNATNNNPGFYRPYDSNTTNNNDEWPFINGSGNFGAGAVGNRNAFGNRASFFETPPPPPPVWPPQPTCYPHLANVNYWPQLYFQQTNFESYAHQYPVPSTDCVVEQSTTERYERSSTSYFDSAIEDSNGSSAYEFGIDGFPVDSPIIATPPTASVISQPTFQSETVLDRSVQPSQEQNPGVSNNVISQQPMFPIWPNAQFQEVHLKCAACNRYGFSAGGLKRHANFCRASQSNLDRLFASLQNPQLTLKLPTSSATSVDAGPINLSTSANATEINPQPMTTDDIPINFCLNESLVESTFIPAKNNNANYSTSPVTPVELTLPPAPSPTPSLPLVEDSSLTSIVTPSTDPSFISIRSPNKPRVTESKRGQKRNCPQCPLVLSSEKALIEHLLTHNVDKPYECSTCRSKFSRKFHLTRHIKQRGCDGTPRAEYPCEHCDKTFSRKDNLREHLKVHNGQLKPRVKLPCPIPLCKKEFQGRTQLQVHMNFHYGLRPYACEVEGCGKSFRSRPALKKHMRIHIFEKPFQCPQCDERYRAKEALSRHMASHDLMKPIKSYICKRCGMAFIQQAHLSEHMIQHQSTESFRCTLCNCSFKKSWRLQKHYRTEHNDKQNGETTAENDVISNPAVAEKEVENPIVEKSSPQSALEKNQPFTCTDCARVFTRKDYLLRHQRTKQHRLLSSQTTEMNEKTSDQISSDQATTGTCSTDNGVGSLDPITGSSSYSTQINSNESQVPILTLVGDFIDVSILEGNIMELLNLLVEPNALSNLGWPNYSVDQVLQSVLIKCGKAPFSNPDLIVGQRLLANTKLLFSFIVDDQAALENLFSRRPVELVLQQVIQLAKSSENRDNIVQLPI